ncbi:hypothetical protein LTV02_30870 [Nocardia yamanashiensis]|uniref:hypothetical protein n=1 Tax=Nocardia yamanashiensis TaxID=209247 RepID=UPI001E32DE09|nr:hypothetical protein [Nocardia yamanashiensis]UGT46056.1 hypothetical protein LTV02_30870 [Nocardia yamanashiensis]
MRFHRLAPLVGAFTLSAILGSAALIPAAAPARAAEESLATVEVADTVGLCGDGAATFDDIITTAATAIRSVVPAGQQSAYDRQVNDFRLSMAQVGVHRRGLPADPADSGGRLQFLDDPIVTYLVNTLDAVRTGNIDKTVSVSQLTVNEVIEVFILATRIVKIPAQLGASLVPTVGFVLKPIVGALFNGVKSLARAVQAQVARTCKAPNAYEKLQLDLPDEHVAVPQPLLDLANQLVKADGSCTPLAELKTSDLVERTRTFLTTHPELGIDAPTVHANAEALQAFLRDNRVAEIVTLRRIEELGPLVNAMDYGPLTFLANLGFDIYEGKALNTVPLGEVKVENAFDLITLTLDTTSLLLTLGTTIAGFTGVASTITTPLGIAQTLAFAPTTYGMPILRGVMQSMCAA